MRPEEAKTGATAASAGSAKADVAILKDRREPWETPRVILSALQETEKFPNIFEGDPGDNNGFNS